MEAITAAAQTNSIVLWVVSTTMWIVLLFLGCTNLLVKGFGNDELLGKGRWFVLNQLQCEDPEQYELPLMVTRRKLNRTHDAFSVNCELDREINVTYGIEIIAHKEVDGGFKFYQKITDDSFCNMCKKYVGENFGNILSKAKIDPPDCPIPEGQLTIDDFVLDYQQLEETGMYGTYDACAYITYFGKRLACVRWLVQFEKEDQDDDEDDK